MNRLSFFRFLSMLILGLTSWSAAVSQSPPESGPGNEEYRFAAGDQLKITVFGHEDLSGEFEVDGVGDIAMPLINEVTAEGRTADELELAIVDALKPDYLKNPNVSVEVLNYRPYYIMGEVTTPGSYPYINGMTVVNAVAIAGGFTYRARKGRFKVVRADGEGAIELEAELDFEILPGDVIEVRERLF